MRRLQPGDLLGASIKLHVALHHSRASNRRGDSALVAEDSSVLTYLVALAGHPAHRRRRSDLFAHRFLEFCFARTRNSRPSRAANYVSPGTYFLTLVTASNITFNTSFGLESIAT